MDHAIIVKDEIRTLLEESKSSALEDGIITQEEEVLLDLLKAYLTDIENQILKVIGSLDDLSEDEIRKRTRLVARDIMPILTKAAKEDGKVSSDEAALLSSILDRIMEV